MSSKICLILRSICDSLYINRYSMTIEKVAVPKYYLNLERTFYELLLHRVAIKMIFPVLKMVLMFGEDLDTPI